MLILRLTQPIAEDFIAPAPPGTPLPEDQAIEIPDLKSASVAYLRFCHVNHLRDCRGEIFDKDGHLQGSISPNARIWRTPDWERDDASQLYEPTEDDWREARGLSPETDEERTATAARIAAIREESSWPKPEPLHIGRAVLLFTTPVPIAAIRATVLDIRKDSIDDSAVEYLTESAENTGWDREGWVHARLPAHGSRMQFSRQTSATLRAEFAAIPVGATGKTLGQIVSEALAVDARTWTLADYNRYDQDRNRLLDEMVELAANAAAKA